MFVLNVFNELQFMYTLFSELGQLNIIFISPQEHNNCIIEMILIRSDYKQNGDMVAVWGDEYLMVLELHEHYNGKSPVPEVLLLKYGTGRGLSCLNIHQLAANESTVLLTQHPPHLLHSYLLTDHIIAYSYSNITNCYC